MKTFSIGAMWLALGLIATESSCHADSQAAATGNPLTAATLVVFNNRDVSSTNLATYYARARGIPSDHLVGLDCPLNEEISRADYDKTIAGPLREMFTDLEWWKLQKNADGSTVVNENKIRFVVLMRGMPLKIAPVADYEGDRHEGQPLVRDHNEAAVDSELSTLGFFSRQISGAINNPYYRSYTHFLDVQLPALMLVCRLDAPGEEIVRSMIDDAIKTEQKGLGGFAYIDERGIKDGPLAEGDEWLRRAAEDARRHGIPVIEDMEEAMFPPGYPMRHAAIYLGWYGENVSGPFASDDFRFERGAIAVHIHSSSAASLRNPHEHWAAPLLARGAAATLGNVYEPYLALTPNLDVFFARLLAGFTFAESAYASQRAISWMTTFVGDPLYRPFGADGGARKATEWTAYREGAKLWFSDREAGERKLRDSAKSFKSGAIAEGLGLLQLSAGEADAASASFALARKFYANPDDAMRATIHEVRLLRDTGKKNAALALAKKQMRAQPQSPACAVLQSLLPQLAPK